MKSARIASLLVVALFVTILGLATTQAIVAQTQGQQNLLTNPGFEAGYYNQDGIAQIAVPNGWRMHWLDNATFPGAEGGLPAYRPETVVWNIADAPEHEQSLFFRDGAYALKVFKGWAPLYAGLSQDVSGLQVGRRYRFVVPIFIDIIEDYQGGKKVAPSRADSGMIRLGASPVGAPWRDEGQITYSGWWTAETVQPFYLAYPVFVWDFTATQENMTLWVEMVSKYPYRNNGFFLDGLGLYTLDQVDTSVSAPAGSGAAAGAGSAGSGGSAPPAQPLPTATPFPTPAPRADGSVVHVVQTGDTFWNIAIRYAPMLNMTPEEALPAIRELNNNPAFINVGQELQIAAPGTLAAAEPTPAEEEETPAVDEETADEEAGAEDSEETAGTAEATVAEPEATDAEPEEAEAAEEAVAANAICVSVYNDENGDGARAGATEALQPDAAVTLFHDGRTLSTYVSDGISEPYCFEDLESGTYQVQVFPPADYKATTPDNWAVAVANGVMVPVNFGTQHDLESAAPAEQVAEADRVAQDAGDGDVPAATAATNASLDNEPGSGLFANVGVIVLGIAGVLVLLAGVGVVLLRRS